MFGRRMIAAVVAEFLGTGILTLLVLSVQRSTIGVPFFVALAAGLTLALMSFAFGDAEGQFNPAVTIALWTTRKIATIKAIAFLVVQFLGAWGAYWLYTYLVNNKLQPIGGHYTARIAIAEGVAAAVLAMGAAAAAYRTFTSAVASSLKGLSYMVAIIAASAASIGLVNPAVALGVRSWVWGSYVLAPVVGAVLGANIYYWVFVYGTENANGAVAAAKVTEVKPTVAKAAKTTAVAAAKTTKAAAKTTKKAPAKTTRKKTTTRRKRS